MPPTSAGCGSSSTASSTTPAAGSGRSTTCWRPGRRRRTDGWFHFDEASLEAGRDRCSRTRRPGRPAERAGLRGLVGDARPAKAQHGRAGGPRVPVRRRGALAAVRDRRLAPGRPGRDRRRGVLAGVPRALPGRSTRRVPGRRDLARRPGLAARRPVRCADELPARRGDPRVRRRRGSSTWRWSDAHHEYAGSVVPRRRRRVRGPARRAARGVYDPRPSRSSSTSSAPTTRRGCARSSAGRARALRMATLLQATLPGAPCIYYGDEVGLTRRQRPGLPRRLSRGTRPAGTRTARLGPRAVPVAAAEPALAGRAGDHPRASGPGDGL